MNDDKKKELNGEEVIIAKEGIREDIKEIALSNTKENQLQRTNMKDANNLNDIKVENEDLGNDQILPKSQLKRGISLSENEYSLMKSKLTEDDNGVQSKSRIGSIQTRIIETTQNDIEEKSQRFKAWDSDGAFIIAKD